MKKNDFFECKITDMNMLGFGIAKIDGIVVFVQSGVTGDMCRIKIIKTAKNYSVARIEEIISPSQHRKNNECPHYFRCGGCSLRHVDYEYEKEIKYNYILSELKKNHLDDVKVNPVVSSKSIYHYRNKAQYPVSKDKNGEYICGFYSPKTHDVVNIDNCIIQNEKFNEIKNYIIQFAKKNNIMPYFESDSSGYLRHIYLRSSKSGDIALTLVSAKTSFPMLYKLKNEIKSKFPEIKTFLLNINSDNTNVILGEKWITVFGDGYINDKIFENTFRISPASFYQVNHDTAEILYKTAFDLASFSKNDTVCDLYCGVGTIGLSLADRVKKIVGVDIVPEAIENAKENAKINSINNAEFFVGDSNEIFSSFPDELKIDAVIVDPPRKGIDKNLIAEIDKRKINKVLYISCGFDTLCRDMTYFRKAGYSFSNITPVDMFPATSHIESAVFIYKNNS